jgi:hypothetical protein
MQGLNNSNLWVIHVLGRVRVKSRALHVTVEIHQTGQYVDCLATPPGRAATPRVAIFGGSETRSELHYARLVVSKISMHVSCQTKLPLVV